jgi:PHD/YefM family antitoxin component YafN of YafNO toxin-antitoxin module
VQSLHTSHVRKTFSETLNQVIYLREHIILERHGKRVAAIIPIEDFDSFVDKRTDKAPGNDASDKAQNI